jgi:hypothetical protein
MTPHVLLRAPDPAQRAALGGVVRCRAGAVTKTVFATVPVLRSGVTGELRIALERRIAPGHETPCAPASLPGSTRQSIFLRKTLVKIDGCAGRQREDTLRAFARA